MRSGGAYPQKAITQKRATAALISLLYGCTLERLQGFTAGQLAGSYNVKISDVEQLLAQAKARRLK